MLNIKPSVFRQQSLLPSTRQLGHQCDKQITQQEIGLHVEPRDLLSKIKG